MVPGVRIYVFKHHVLRVVSMYDLCALMCRVFHRCFRIMYVLFPLSGFFRGLFHLECCDQSISAASYQPSRLGMKSPLCGCGDGRCSFTRSSRKCDGRGSRQGPITEPVPSPGPAGEHSFLAASSLYQRAVRSLFLPSSLLLYLSRHLAVLP